MLASSLGHHNMQTLAKTSQPVYLIFDLSRVKPMGQRSESDEQNMKKFVTANTLWKDILFTFGK